MYERDLKTINDAQDLVWGSDGFLKNPISQGSLSVGNAFEVKSYRDAVLTAVGTGTILVYGSSQKNPPDFSQASSINNSWVLISLMDYSLVGSASFYTGATGAVVSSSTMLAELDTNLLTWIGIHRSANTVNAKLTIASTQ